MPVMCNVMIINLSPMPRVALMKVFIIIKMSTCMIRNDFLL